MKNLFIQKIIESKDTNNKPFRYLVTININKLEYAKVFDKQELLDYLDKTIT